MLSWLNLSKPKIEIPANPDCINSLCAKMSKHENRGWHNQRLDSSSFVVFDTETTGLSAQRGDEIISFGAVRIEANALTSEHFCQLVNPNRNVPLSVTLLTGISEDMLENEADFWTAFDQFLQFAGSHPLVAHNAQFDLSFINLKLRRYFRQSLRLPVLDTFLIAQLLHPNRKSYSLDNLAGLYGVPLEERHTALGDSIITGKIFLAMTEELVSRGIREISELISYLKFRRLL